MWADLLVRGRRPRRPAGNLHKLARASPEGSPYWISACASASSCREVEIRYIWKMLLRLGALVLSVVFAASAADRYALTPGERQLNVNSFEYVWKTVRDNHWDPQMGGLNWQSVHDELLPKVEKAGTMEKAREVMTAMLGRLKQTHFGIFPADLYKEMDSPGSRDGNPGIDVRIIDSKAVITSVDPGSPAAVRGVKPGWLITRVDGKDVLPGIRKIQEGFSKSTLLDIMLTRSITSRLYGKVGKAVTVDLMDEKDQSVGLEL